MLVCTEVRILELYESGNTLSGQLNHVRNSVQSLEGVLAAILILTVLFKMLKPDTVYKVFGILYIGTVSIMCAVSLQNMITIASRQSAVFAAGAVLFLISDVVLIFNIFGNRVSHLRRVINLSCYYIAQLLIAITIML